MQGFPLYSMLKAAGLTKLDYISLDLEGIELEVSKAFKILDTQERIKVIPSPFHHAPIAVSVFKPLRPLLFAGFEIFAMEEGWHKDH